MSKFKLSLFFIFAALSLQSCDYARSNTQKLVTHDCGVNWIVLEPGDMVPRLRGACSYSVDLPNHPMQGDAVFKTAFKDNVLAQIDISYDYEISSAKKFIANAKYLGRQHSTESTDDKTFSSLYENAENSLIDAKIKDVARSMLLMEDVVEFSQADFEIKLLAELNKQLLDKGLELNFISFAPLFEEQTKLTIDVCSARKIYASRNMVEVGDKIALNRAGASNITVQK